MDRSQVATILKNHANNGGGFNMYGNGIVGNYYGPLRVQARAAVLSEMIGETVRVSDKRVGWGRWRDAIAVALQVAPGCLAAQESEINGIVFGRDRAAA